MRRGCLVIIRVSTAPIKLGRVEVPEFGRISCALSELFHQRDAEVEIFLLVGEIEAVGQSLGSTNFRAA
jgi:hypothetical protein